MTTPLHGIAATGLKKSYPFAPFDSRELTKDHLEEQLRGAGHRPTEKYDPSERRAR